MTTITVDIPKELDRKIALLKANREMGSKSSMIVKIIEEYFEYVISQSEKEKIKKDIENWM